MLVPHVPHYPSNEFLASLSERTDVRVWHLPENFQPRRSSSSIHQPVSWLSPDLQLNSSQWLVEASSSFNVSLNCGLLRIGNRIVYEINPTNRPTRRRSHCATGFLPPGWWHFPRTPNRFKEPLLLLSTHNNHNYFHWVTQPGLTPLFLQDYFRLPTPQDLTIAVSHRPRSSFPSYLNPLLQLFAPNTKVAQGISFKSDSISRFSLQSYSGPVFISPAQILWLRERCQDVLKTVPNPERRILISRQHSTRRRCLNEDHLYSMLHHHGFERFCLEDMSPIQQLQLFSESAVIVGAHGAAFTNLVACRESTIVVELFPRPGSFSHYYAVADILGLRHGHLLASRYLEPSDDFTVAPAELFQLLIQMEAL